jgi:MFS superfamily sulfate permease-like transporter
VLPGVLIVRVRENLDFANTTNLKERLRRLELYGTRKHHPSDTPSRARANALVFHMADMESIDASATQIFVELLESSKARGVGLYFAHMREGPMRLWRKAGIVDLLGEVAFQQDVTGVIARLEQVEGITMRRRDEGPARTIG